MELERSGGGDFLFTNDIASCKRKDFIKHVWWKSQKKKKKDFKKSHARR